jgi:hypothetical protein
MATRDRCGEIPLVSGSASAAEQREVAGVVGRAFEQISRHTLVVAAAVVVGVFGGTWALSGVVLSEILRFIAFEGIFVLFPGCTLYVLLSRHAGGWLRTVAIGWPLGYALEMAAFALTAAIGAREAFVCLPASAALIWILKLRRERVGLGMARLRLQARFTRYQTDGNGLELLAVAVIASIAQCLLALRFFAFYPLPRDARSVYYSGDNLYHISIAAEARYHWPVTTPYAAGEPLRYYIGVFIHFAAINQASGVSLPTIVLRLFPSIAIVVIALQLWLLGRMLGRSRWIGPTAAALFLVVEELDLDPTRPTGFSADFFNSIPGSPTAAFGITFFLGLLAVVYTRVLGGARVGGVSPTRLGPSSTGQLVVIGILVMAAGAAKIFAAVDFVGAVFLYWLWRAFVAKADRWFVACLVVSLVGYLVIDELLLSGNELSPTVGISPLAFVYATSFAHLLHHGAVIHYFVLLGAGIVVCACVFTPLLGSLWLLLKPRRASPAVSFSVATFIFAFAAYALLTFLNESLIYLLWYGYLAMIPVSALGLTRLIACLPRDLLSRLVRAGFVIVIAGIALAGSTRLLVSIDLAAHTRRILWYAWYAGAYGLVACLVVFAALRAERGVPGIGWRPGRVLTCCIPLVVALGFVKPVALNAPRAWETVFHDRIPVPDSTAYPGLSAALYRGLAWVRAHTTPCDVLAVNTHYRAGRLDDHYPYYSALTERQMFLEAWNTTVKGSRGEQPFPARLALNTAATHYASPAALRELGRIGVSYVLIDKTHGGGAKEAASVSRLVFTNSAVNVYRLLVPARRSRRACGTISWTE